MKEEAHVAPIPESLQNQLNEFRRQLWKIKIIEGVLAGVFGLIISYLAVFISDRFWSTPWWLGIVILLAGMVGFGLVLPWMIHRWVWKNRRANQLARLIAKQDPHFGDRLLGIVELQDQDDRTTALSIVLRNAAMQQVANEAGKRDLKKSVPRPLVLRWSLVTLAAVAVVVCILTMLPDAGQNAFKRWINPMGNVERYTFTRIEKLPEQKVVALGESFEQDLSLAKNSEQQPETARAKSGEAAWLEAQLTDGKYKFTFPGLQQEEVVKFQVGDTETSMIVVPKRRPGILDVSAKVIYPEYLGRGSEVIPLRSGVLSVVKGSSANLTARATSPLAKAWMTNSAESIFVKGNEFTQKTGEVKESKEMEFSWQDVDGLKGDTFYRMRIECVEDQVPVAYVSGVEKRKMVLEGEAFDFDVQADDDYGLKKMGIEWEGSFTKPQPGSPAKGELVMMEGNQTKTRLAKPFTFSASAMNISPQTLTIRPFAEDYLPGRPRTYGDPITVWVLDKNEHAQMLKENLERLTGQLEDVVRNEENLLDETHRLKKLDGAELQKAENKERLKRQADEEERSRDKIEELSKNLEQLFKDAARNDEVDKKALQKLNSAMQDMKNLPQNELKKAQESFDQAAEETNTPEKSQNDLAEAEKEQQKALDKMKSALKKTSQASQNFEASTFVARLRKAADQQEGLAKMFIALMNEVVGQVREQVDPTHNRSIDGASRQQRVTAGDIRWIREDLAHFYARTNKEIFGQLFKEMETAKIDLQLDNLIQEIEANHGAVTIDRSLELASVLRVWAKKIDDSNKESQGGAGGGGGGGAGGGEQGMSESDFEFMLRVMRMIQQQQDLRARTRSLEQFRREKGLVEKVNPTVTKPAVPQEGTPKEESKLAPTSAE